MNEKFALSLGARPVKVPVIVVIPLRDVPGISARTCARPIIKDCRILTDSTDPVSFLSKTFLSVLTDTRTIPQNI